MSKGAGTARGLRPARVRGSDDPGRFVADAGLTLLELCITVALLGIALAALVGSIASASSLSDRAAAKTESESYGRRIAEIIRDPKFPTYLCGIDTLPQRYTSRVAAVLGAPTTTTISSTSTTSTTSTTTPSPGGGMAPTTFPNVGAGTTTTTRPTTTTTLAPTSSTSSSSTSTTSTTAPNTTNADLSFAITDVRWTTDPDHMTANPDNWTAISCSSSNGDDGQPIVQSNITVMIWVEIQVWPTSEPNYVTTVSVLKRGLTS